MTTTLKWTEDRTQQLVDLVGGESPVSRETVSNAAEALEVSERSIAAKLRKLGFEVTTVAAAPKAFDDETTEALRAFLGANSGVYTYAELAEAFQDGRFSAKAIQGKVLSMELTEAVKKAPKVETVKTYTDAEESTVIEMANNGRFVEEIADAVGKTVASVRGKTLSLMRAGKIEAIPAQRDRKEATPDAFEALGDVSGLTVAEIAAKLDKTEKGVKTMLTRRGVDAADYKGAAKHAKNEEKKAA